MAWLAYASPRNYSPGEWAEGSDLQSGSSGAADERNYQPGEWASGASIPEPSVSPDLVATESLGSALIPWVYEAPPGFSFVVNETVTADDSGSWAEPRRGLFLFGGRQTTDSLRRQIAIRDTNGDYTTLLNQTNAGPISSIRRLGSTLYACGSNTIGLTSYSRGQILVSTSLGKEWTVLHNSSGVYGIRDVMPRLDGKIWFTASHWSGGTGCFEFDPGTSQITLLKATSSNTDVAGYMTWTGDDDVWFLDANARAHHWNGSVWTTYATNDWGSGSEDPFIYTWGGTDVAVGVNGNYGSHMRRWNGSAWKFWPNHDTIVWGDQPFIINGTYTYWGQAAGPSIDDFYVCLSTGTSVWYGIEWRDRIAHWNGSSWELVWDQATGTGGQAFPVIHQDPYSGEYMALFYNRVRYSYDGTHWFAVSGPSLPNVSHTVLGAEALPPTFFAQRNEAVEAADDGFAEGPFAIGRRRDETVTAADSVQRAMGYHFTCNEVVTASDEPRANEIEYCDYFDDGTPLRTLPGNGSVVETGGELVLTSNPGVNSDWWTSGRSGILAYQPIPPLAGPSWVIFETELNSLTIPDPTYSHVMWGLHVDDGNFVYIGLRETSLWVGGTTGYASWWSAGTTTITLPVRVRIIWHPSSNVVHFDWHNGTDWQRIYSRTSYTLQYERVFFYNKTWNYAPQLISNWEYLCVWPLATTLDLERLNVLDSVEFPASSVETTLWPTPEIPEGLVKDESRSNATDGMEYPSSSVEDPFWSAPEVPEGTPRTSQGAGIPDDFFWTIGRAQYKAESQSTDGEGHPHFLTYRPYLLHAGDTSREAWHNPTLTSFTGYGRDGTHYTSGVQDPGPVYAPWYSEAASSDRSSVGPFPQKYLLAVTRTEIVVFDFANYPTSLDVWMRFQMGETTGSTYTLFGRQAETLASIQMVNGVLIGTTLENGTDRGRIHLIDFKQDTQRFANLIGSDNHWMGVSGRDITDRNLASNWTTSGVSPSLRIRPEYPYSMSAYSLADGSKYWVAVGGEDQGPDIIEVDASGIPQYQMQCGGETGGDNIGNVRRVLFDRDGWFWHSYYGRLYRAGVTYQDRGLLPIPSSDIPQYPFVDLGGTISDLVDSENFIYAATDIGVYRIHRGTLETRLIWTIAGGGGVGLSGVPGAGELLVGTKSEVARIRAYSLNGSGYIAVATRLDGGNLHGGVTLIKTKDDTVLDSKLYPELAEDGAYVSIPVGL